MLNHFLCDMYQNYIYPFPLLLLAVLLLSSGICLAQQTTFSINNEKVNQRSGISLKAYQQLDEVFLKLESAGNSQLSDFQEVKIFRARGSRPLQELTYNQAGEKFNITKLLRHAEAGDRLVIELIGRKADEPGEKPGQIVVLALH